MPPTALAPLQASRPTADGARRGFRTPPCSPRACRECVAAAALSSPPARPNLLQRGASASPLAALGPKDEEEEEDAPSSSSSYSSSDPMRPSSDDAPPLAAALAALRFYKAAISPLLPPSCRFLPTCSEYAARAYREFGIGKGTVLTAWRLMRCNPLGGRGYDPPTWPPPGWKGGE